MRSCFRPLFFLLPGSGCRSLASSGASFFSNRSATTQYLPPRSYLYALTHNPITFSAPSLSDAQQLPNINLQSNSSHQRPSRPIPPLIPNTELSSSLSDEAIACLQCFYPNLVHIPKTLLDEGSRPWKQSLMGKFLGRPLSVDKVFKGLSALWQTQGEWEIFPMSYGFFIFHFTRAADINRVLHDGP